ncbi:MAG: hypothetical protein RL316_948 [Bacteroidota bacterium]
MTGIVHVMNNTFSVRVFDIYRNLFRVVFQITQVLAPHDKLTIDVESVTASLLDNTMLHIIIGCHAHFLRKSGGRPEVTKA